MKQNNYNDMNKLELIELVNYYKSEYVLVCNFYNNEKKEHRKTKSQLKLFKERTIELAQKYNDLKEVHSRCQ